MSNNQTVNLFDNENFIKEATEILQTLNFGFPTAHLYKRSGEQPISKTTLGKLTLLAHEQFIVSLDDESYVITQLGANFLANLNKAK